MTDADQAPPEGERPLTTDRALQILFEWANRRHPEHSDDQWCVCEVCKAIEVLKVAAPAPPADDSWGGHGTIKAAPPAAGGLADLTETIKNVLEWLRNNEIPPRAMIETLAREAAAVEAARPAPIAVRCTSCGDGT
jgi:hypothetical protein